MVFSRIDGADELYLGGIFGLRRTKLIQELKITHILSVIKATLKRDELGHVEHLSIDINDMEDEDILVHLPRMVRFIDRGLRGGEGAGADDKVDGAAATDGKHPPCGAVFVHCAVGKSRSVTAIMAYLLWKYPRRFQAPTSREAVAKALEWVRRSRPIAGPNSGFMSQLELWRDMGCPADSDDAVEKHPAYQRWLYRREVEDATRIGRAPNRFRFEDEEAPADGAKAAGEGAEPSRELRCKKCRRVLATDPFIVSHRGLEDSEQGRQHQPCPHFFVEALSWMRPILEEGELDGRLICPNAKCAASIGRYAWQGFKCSCGQWVTPAFSLQVSKVDEVVIGGRARGGAAATAAALNIRMPPGASSPVASGVADRAKQNL